MSRYELRTARSVYVVAEAPEGLVLEHWGDPARVPERPSVRRASFETAADVAPLEYAAAGTRYTQTSELLVEGPVDGARLQLRSVTHADGSLRAELADDDTGIEVVLHWRTSLEHDVVERWARIRSTRHEVALTRAFTAGWNVPVGPGARVTQLVGTWSREFTPAEVDLPAGQLRLGSRQGVTSHEYSPVVALRSRADPGEAYGVALAWSGSWRMQVDAVPFRDVVRVSAGVDDESTVITLGPGDGYETPRMLGVWSADGAAGLANAWHDYQRGTLARPGDRPVVYNSWYATGFDVRVEHQLALADVAAGIGAEVFVVDDGWFAGRTSDRAGLGDWHVDPEKFPDGLKPLVAGVLERGMRFGLWVEPEAVNPDSDLYRAHPEWVYRAGDRPLTTMRNQYVLDLGRPEVEAWAAAMLRRLLTEHPISYLKWDMNRAVTDGGRPGGPHGREWTIAHTRAYYRLMRLLRDEFPHVTVEACAGGGGRIDNAVLALSDVVWPSDETGPRGRLAIQHGFLSAYPPSVMSSWVTDEPDRLDTAPASLEFRFVVAMAGVLGIGSDLLAWDTATSDRARELVALYRELRPVIHAGDVTRLGEPGEAHYAVQYTAGSRVVVLVWRRPGDGPVRVRLAGLEPGAQYRFGEEVLHGAALRVGGLTVPFALAPDCDVVVLDRLA
ncbi:alpha-galactosidase [Pseudonocardia sp. TRM90224]|uniref:alpha-galactosidase n=1 Tax=Pseudonocardia sp. TRM90224 TaxID=2812678 RepID=UPI001E3C5CBD|nr:alpha-galactosidase [Pseudonocardia sp. TRM90224]